MELQEKDYAPSPQSSNSTATAPTLHRTTTDPHYGDRDPDEDEEVAETLSKARSRASGRDSRLQQTLSRRETFISKIRTRQPTGKFSHPLGHVQTTAEQLVDFEGDDDPYRPVNWSTKKKLITTLIYGLTTMTSTWASSTFSAGTDQISHEYHVGTQTVTLGTSLFLLGFGIGPLLWAPLSEVYGRKIAVLPPTFIAACFAFATACSYRIDAIMITRFFSGFFGSAPVTNTGGVLGDIYTPMQRGIAMAGYAMAVVGGPVLGPIVGAAFVSNPSLGWRWTEYFTVILQLFILAFGVIFLDETYPPKLLVFKARRLRHETGNWALHTKFEEWDVSISELARKFLVRPFVLLTTPICFLVALYASFCYGILYMQLGAIPIIFSEIRHWKPVASELPFLAILVGAMGGAGINVLNQFQYNRIAKENGAPVPEARLPPMCFGSFLFAGGQFITGWTAGPEYPWIAPVIGLVMMGIGFFCIFQAALNYLVDTFTKYAASAIGANTFLRSVFAAAFPLVVAPLYHNIGTGPGSTITGGFAALLIPVPFIFMRYGKAIRSKNKWSRESVK